MADERNLPPYTSNFGNWKSKAEGKAATKKYRASDAFKNLNGKKHAFIGEKKILRLLSQDGAVGIRTYIGLDAAGDPQLFMVAVDEKGFDILVVEKATKEQSEGLILDDNGWCPPFCDPPQDFG